jgi:hypothetical protein
MINWFNKKPTTAPYTSDHLYHLVGRKHPKNDLENYNNLVKVLTDECISYYPHEKGWGEVSYYIDWSKSILGEELIAPTMTCFADIPYESLSIHIIKYGKFGLCFKREYLIKFGARPVTYFPLAKDHWGSPFGEKILLDIEAIYKGFYIQVASKNKTSTDKKGRFVGESPQNEINAIDQINNMVAKDFLAFIKPFDSHLDKDHQDNFYMEREWRKFGNLVFNPDDVVKILVAKGFASRLQKAFPSYEGKIVDI